MMFKFDYKVNKNLANLLPIVDEVYVKSVISHDEAPKVTKNQLKLKQKHPGKKLPKFDDALRKEWKEWYIPMKTFLNGMDKFKKKLPHFYHAKAVGFGVFLEQSTGEHLARWKARQFPAKQIVSLTGGLGVDDWAWADSGSEVYSFDTNETINFWSTFNFDRLGVGPSVHRYTQSAEWAMEHWEQWLSNTSKVDLIYVDPDRRPADAHTTGRITANVAQYSPNVIELFERHKERASQWLIKLSPMVDIHWFQSQINRPIHAFALCNKKEVKEILVLIASTSENALNPEDTPVQPIVKEMVWIEEHVEMRFSDFWQEADLKTTNSPISTSKPEDLPSHIFEPHAGLFAMGLNQSLSSLPFLTSLGNFSFYLSDSPLPHWLGRTLHIEKKFSGSLREIAKAIKAEHWENVTITARNCGMNTADLIKQLGTRENHAKHGFIYKNQKEFTLYVGTI